MVLPDAVKIVFYKKTKFMSRYLFLSVVLVCGFCACNPAPGKPTESELVENVAADLPVNLLGSYVGAFGDNKITLLITNVTGDSVEGRSVVGGNDRPYSGVIKHNDGKYTVNAKEPGDDKYDGVFNFTIDSKQPDIVTGNWKPNVATQQLGPKNFSLNRRAFVYLVDVGQYPIASKQLLTDDDVNNLVKEELEIMRNEIFARHGYCFKRKNLREQFEDKDWYIPNTVDVKKDLTEIEKKNILLIKRFEKYAVEFGDDYGR